MLFTAEDLKNKYFKIFVTDSELRQNSVKWHKLGISQKTLLRGDGSEGFFQFSLAKSGHLPYEDWQNLGTEVCQNLWLLEGHVCMHIFQMLCLLSYFIWRIWVRKQSHFIIVINHGFDHALWDLHMASPAVVYHGQLTQASIIAWLAMYKSHKM